MDRRAGVRLREDERIRRPGELAHLRWKPGEAVRNGLRLRLPQNSESRAWHRGEHVLPLLGSQLVFAVAEKGEVVVVDPLEQRLRLGELVGSDRRRMLVEVRDDLANVPAHRRPVLDRGAHVGKNAVQLGFELVEARLIGLPVDLDVQERLGGPVGCPWQ